jgi:hypothetical protein
LQPRLAEVVSGIDSLSESQERKVLDLIGLIRGWADELESKPRG